MAELNTYGDLKKVIKAIELKQKGEKIGKIALGTLLSFIPGAEAAKTTFEFMKAAMSKPDTKKTDTWLDKLDVDDEMSAIVDDTVENGFMQAMADTIESKSDSLPLESDFNMNAEMVEYLRDKYEGRTVSGIKENNMKERFKQLAGIKEETIDVENLKKLVDNSTTLKNRLQTVNNAKELEEFLEYILSIINPKITGVNVSKLKGIIDNKF